jgi:hypothetical protein
MTAEAVLFQAIVACSRRHLSVKFLSKIEARKLTPHSLPYCVDPM